MKRLLLLLGVCLFVSNAKAQIRDYYDDRVFYYDDYGWSVALSLGTVLYGEQDYYLSFKEVTAPSSTIVNALSNISAKGTLELKETLLPSFMVTGEYKPYMGLSFDTGLTYFSHDLSEEGTDVGSSSRLIWFVGGNYNFDEVVSRLTPYVTADVGLAYNFVNLESENVELLDDSSLSLATQAGAGVDINVGPVKLGLLYNYVLTNGYELELILPAPVQIPNSEGAALKGYGFDFDSLGGHKIELKGTIKPSILNN